MEVGRRGAGEGFFVYGRENFVEDEEGILDERMRLKKTRKKIIEKDIAKRGEDHALVVAHAHANRRAVSKAVKINRFNISERRASALP